MVLEGADGLFGGVVAMEVRRGELVVDILVDEELLESLGRLVVKLVESGADATSFDKLGM